MPETHVTDRVAVVTGGSSGIGREVVRELGWRGASVVLVSRASGSGAAVAADIRHETGNEGVVFMPADLSSMEEVRDAIARIRDRYDRVHLLLNNAGAYFGSRTVTADGFEATFALSHLAHFLLTLGLEDRLVAAGESGAPARVVTTSSGAARGAEIDWDDLMLEQSYAGWRAYGRTKLANQLFALELAERWADAPVVSHVFHPGLVDTDFGPDSGILRWFWKKVQQLLGRSSREGALTALYLLCHPEPASSTGRYWEDCEPHQPAPGARDPEARSRLWQRSDELTGVSDL